MNLLSHQIVLSRGDELLRQAADYRLTHQPKPKTAPPRKRSRGTLLKPRRGFIPKSA
jgi:hypothetical protein